MTLLSALIGVMLSQGMGEVKAAPYLETRVQAKSLRLSAQGEWSRKVESGQGYRLGADAEWFGPLILSAAYRYRDGGAWTKQGAWAGIGYGSFRHHVILRHELAHNRTLSLGAVLSMGRIETQATIYRYRQGQAHQNGATLLVGLVL